MSAMLQPLISHPIKSWLYLGRPDSLISETAEMPTDPNGSNFSTFDLTVFVHQCML